MKRVFIVAVLSAIFLLESALTEAVVRIGIVTPDDKMNNPEEWNIYHALYIEELSKYLPWEYRLIYLEKSKAYPALERGLTDILLPLGEEYKQNTKIRLGRYMDYFDERPTYAAAMPENIRLLSELAGAQKNFNEQNGGYAMYLFSENYRRTQRRDAEFTPEEENFCRIHAPLRVVIYGDRPPYTYVNKGGEPTGIYPDIIRAIADKAGLSLEFIVAEGNAAAAELLRGNAADLLVGVYNNDKSVDFTYTNTVYTEDISFICRENKSFDGDIRAVLVGNLPAMQRYIEREFPRMEVFCEPFMKDAFDKVSKGKADLAAIDSLTLQIRHPLLLFPSLGVSDRYSLKVPRSLAISQNQPAILRSVLNKAIMRLEPREINQIVNKNISEMETGISITYILYYYPLQFGLALGLIILLFTVVAFFYQYNRQIRLQKAILTEKNAVLVETLEALDDANAAADDYKYKAETDALTRVLNKAAIENFAHDRLKRLKEGKRDALFIVDLDHFKEANDTRGHQYGDMILVDFARSLSLIARKGDGVGRFGGDEFILYAKDVKKEELPQIAERIREASHALDAEQRPPLSASIGVAVAPANGRTYDELFRAADRALYYVKENGRDNFKIAATGKK